VCARKLVMLPVQLADDRTVTIEADSSLTAAEACRHIAKDIALRDQFGFAVYISIYDKVRGSPFLVIFHRTKTESETGLQDFIELGMFLFRTALRK